MLIVMGPRQEGLNVMLGPQKYSSYTMKTFRKTLVSETL